MSKIEFISHDAFPEDEYTKEIVYLCLEGRYRIAYMRKMTKNGGLFWSVATIGATRNGQKEFFPAFVQDSNFLEKDIKNFLDSRSWEKRNVFTPTQSYEKPTSMDEVAESNGIPF